MLPPATVNQKLYIRSLPFEAAKTAVACFVITQVDRCNWWARTPKCLLDRLQSLLKSAARLFCNHRKYDLVTPLLRDRLHWFRCSTALTLNLPCSSTSRTDR